MSLDHKSLRTQENIPSQLNKESKIEVNIVNSKFDNEQTSQNTQVSSPKHLKTRLSFDNRIASSISETLTVNAKKVKDMEKDKKTYQLRCETIINRIEVMKKQDREMNKRITKLNKQKVASAKVKAEKLHRYQKIEDIRKEKEEEIRQKKKKAHEERIEERSLMKAISDAIKEEKKKKYEKRVRERKRASSYVNECKTQIAEEKKIVCRRVKEDLANPNEIKTSLRVRKEVKRNSTIEKKLEEDELYTEHLKIRIKELEKEEETVYQHVSNTMKANEDMLHYSSSDFMTFKAKPTKTKTNTVKERTKSSCSNSSSTSFFEKSGNEATKMQQRYNERIKELNQLLADGKMSTKLKKK